jgi:hypothetical protein
MVFLFNVTATKTRKEEMQEFSVANLGFKDGQVFNPAQFTKAVEKSFPKDMYKRDEKIEKFIENFKTFSLHVDSQGKVTDAKKLQKEFENKVNADLEKYKKMQEKVSSLGVVGYLNQEKKSVKK